MISRKYGLYVHGQYIHTSQYWEARSPFVRDNPVYPTSLGQVSYLKRGDCTSEDIFESVIVGARETFAQVQRGFFPLPERIAFLQRLHDKISDQAFGLADLISREVAKPISLAKAEVDRAILTLKYTIKTAEEVLASETLDFSSEKLWQQLNVRIHREARGPVLAITPFNFPLNLVIHKLAPAIAAGCPVLLKPSPKALVTAISLVDLCHACELPPGMLCFIPAEDEMTQAFAQDENIPIISFTGSSKVGWAIKAAHPRKHVFLELGGNAPAYVHEDATKLDKIAQQLVQSAFGYAGQSCISCQNIYVAQKNLPAFQKALVEAAQKITFAEPQNEQATLSAVIDSAAAARIQNTLRDARSHGSEVIFEGEGRFVADAKATESALVKPTLLLNTPPNHSLCRDEIFGPVANLSAIDSFDDFVGLANGFSHRLQASVFSENTKLLEEAQIRLNYGGVICNLPPNTRVDAAPYGGEGLAGDGREGPRWAMEDFTRWKTVVSAL